MPSLRSIDLILLVFFVAGGGTFVWLSYRLRRAEAGRRASADLALARAERLETIIKTSVDGIIVIDERGIIETFNPAAERLFGYTAAEIVGRNVGELMTSPDREEHGRHLRDYLAGGEAKVIGRGRQVSGRRKDGSIVPLQLSVGEMHVQGARKFTGIVHDLTRRIGAETKLRDQATLVRIGEMAAVLAHEVKNPLAGIRGVVQLLGGRIPVNDPDHPLIDEVIARIDSVDALMKDLLLFARPPRVHRTSVEVSTLIVNTARLMSLDPQREAVDVRIRGGATAISADPNLLAIVFQNLLINSADAMNGRGTIEITIDDEHAGCRVVIRDHGPGIAEELRDRIWTPFFTTKTRGTGLGLPTARRLVEAHHGEITMDFPAPGGTATVIRLPRQEPASPPSM